MEKRRIGETEARTAMFIDLENTIISAQTMGLPFDVPPILNKLKEFGYVSIRRSYGDLSKICHDTYIRDRIRHSLIENMVNIADIPYLTDHKNTADMQLIVDALSIAYQYSDIDSFAIVASDRDYIPLIAKLHELGREVIGIGVSTKQVSPIYVQSCDKFIYYENLIEIPAVDLTTLSPEDTAEKLDAYYELLTRAISTLEERGIKATGKELIQIIYRLQADFNPVLAGCGSFREFIKKAEEHKVVKVLWPTGNSQGDFVVLLRPGTEPQARKTVVLPEYKLDDPSKAANYYRALLQRKLKVQFPKYNHRKTIFKAIEDMYNYMSSRGQVQMKELSDEAYRKYIEGNKQIEQRQVYKLLYSLFLAGCFTKCSKAPDNGSENEESQYNPVMTLECPPSVWEYKVNLVFLRGIVMEDGQAELIPEGLSWLFYEDLEHLDEANRMIGEIKWNPNGSNNGFD